DLVREVLEKEGLTKLPIVILNGKLIKKGQFLSNKEIGDILDIGISTQETDGNY
ncbi:TPA: arsenic metallochaperone ArsD family protein, partial [Listeria monocytogenes]|nr:arsenic metallochaperone ArsD family protein [Listeria monocytogenes]EAE9894923.1 arsenic metallochaperone ArsD family protein [Listeria monocytogenes]EJD3262636.1 arsenic metallochaperone ArsD family protein [Listeria monocytogenes]HAC2150942.1 arsenic metallochaperone ArsD family protein [Listeria monocytogenes]HEM0398855.1 arsenic metallochaperone ArsD family protein [Listeria monocytogenes]